MTKRRKPPALPEGSKEKLYLALKRTRTKGQYQRALCLWMRAALDMTSDQIAEALGLTSSGVRKIQWRWRRLGDAVFKAPGKGGPHHRYLAIRVERAFLDRLLAATLPANAVMNTRFVQEEFEKMVGHPVSYSVIYRLLKRHGWRPVGSVRMRVPQRWEAAKLPLTDELSWEDESPANGDIDKIDAEFKAAMKNYDSPERPIGRGQKRWVRF